MQAQKQQIEHVARAFYSVESDGLPWDSASDDLKIEFRRLACDAIASADALRETRSHKLRRAAANVREMVAVG